MSATCMECGDRLPDNEPREACRKCRNYGRHRARDETPPEPFDDRVERDRARLARETERGQREALNRERGL